MLVKHSEGKRVGERKEEERGTIDRDRERKRDREIERDRKRERCDGVRVCVG